MVTSRERPELSRSTPRLNSLQRPESLARRAYSAVRRAMRDRSIVPGPLYSELQLAAALSISRTPVREALIELAREGLIEIVPQRGFRLRTINADEERELFDLRQIIESYVVQKLATEASADTILELRLLAHRENTNLDDALAFVEADEEFHLALPGLAGLQRTRDMLSTLRSTTFLAQSTPIQPARLPNEHEQIIRAIESKDPAQAVRTLGDHLQNLYGHFLPVHSPREHAPL
jgi:GntR family transcriptional regulator, rspAB operon transcriptional repressor